MDQRTTASGFRMKGRIDRLTHDVQTFRERFPSWDEMSESEKLAASRQVEPIDRETVYNVTTDALHEYFVDNLDPGQTDAAANVEIAWLGLGTNASGGTATSDEDLNTRTYEETVTDVADNGKDVLASTFLDSTEGNGNNFDEIGLFTGDPANLDQDEVFLINHATFSDVTKDNSKTVTFDVTLTFGDA